MKLISKIQFFISASLFVGSISFGMDKRSLGTIMVNSKDPAIIADCINRGADVNLEVVSWVSLDDRVRKLFFIIEPAIFYAVRTKNIPLMKQLLAHPNVKIRENLIEFAATFGMSSAVARLKFLTHLGFDPINKPNQINKLIKASNDAPAAGRVMSEKMNTAADLLGMWFDPAPLKFLIYLGMDPTKKIKPDHFVGEALKDLVREPHAYDFSKEEQREYEQTAAAIGRNNGKVLSSIFIDLGIVTNTNDTMAVFAPLIGAYLGLGFISI